MSNSIENMQSLCAGQMGNDWNAELGMAARTLMGNDWNAELGMKAKLAARPTNEENIHEKR
jgi:hypothetical protein